MRRILLLFVTILFFNQVQSQQIFNEDFIDSTNTSITAAGWTQIGATTTNPIKIVDSSLQSANYVLSGIGNKIQLNTSGQDVYRDSKISRNSGTLYTSFLLNVNTAGSGDYFLGLLPQTSTTTFTGRIYIKATSTGYYKIGISKGSTTQTAIESTVYSIDSFAINTDQLFVLKYLFVTGTSNDSVFLYSLPNGMVSAEPAQATISTKGGSNTDPASLGRVFLRQGTTGSSSVCYVDGIRMGLSWLDLNSPTINFPKAVSALNFNGNTTISFNINWTKPSDYNDTTMSTLVFLKKSSAVVQGNPLISAENYLANNDFTQTASLYENDTLAKCVFKGDLNSVSISGLSSITTYHALVYVVRNEDSAYSASTIISGATLSTTPASISGLTFTASSQNEAIINWNKPTSYNNLNHTTVVFLKSGSTITAGTSRNMNPDKIFPDSNFLGTGTKFQNDTNAKCIYKGDGNSVHISGLAFSTNYYLLAYVINDADSAYSGGASASGLSSSAGPLNVTSLKLSPLETGKLKISWNKNTDYSNSDFTTLVYLKKSTTIKTGVNNINPQIIIADSGFQSGTMLNSDTLALCVYKGDNNSVTVNNLISANTYYALVYVVRDADSSYSNSSLSNGTVRSLPVSNIKMSGLTASTANISWTSAAGYITTGFNTLVFVKKDQAINIGQATKTTSGYTASTTLGFGTSYQNDAEAYCVYKGDLSTVNISGLNSQFTYHVLIFIVKDSDSTYSEAAIGAGSSLGIPTVYKIGEMNKVNPISGVPDSLGKRATLRGIVYGSSQSTNGLRFTFRDETGGIVALSTTKTFGYSPKEGDSIEAQGSIAVAAGLTEISSLDTIILLDNSKSLKTPVLLNEKINESHESDLVRYNRISFINAPTGGVWVRNSVVNCRINNTTDTLVLRILNNSPLIGKAIPNTATFNATGIVTQVSSSNIAPFPFNGYQLIMRDSNDISSNPDTLSPFVLNSPSNNSKLSMNGNSAQTVFFNWKKSEVLIGSDPVNYILKIDLSNGNFSLPLFSRISSNNGTDTFVQVSYEDLSSALGLSSGDSLVFKWTVTAISMGSERWATQKWNLTCVRGSFTGLNLSHQENSIEIYPNPVKDQIKILSTKEISSAEIYDINGRLVQTLDLHENQSLSHLQSGIYILKLKTENSESFRKFIKE